MFAGEKKCLGLGVKSVNTIVFFVTIKSLVQLRGIVIVIIKGG